MILLGILAILIGMSVLIFLENRKNFSCDVTCGFFSGCIAVLGVIILCLNCIKQPSALDVYRNNTTLKVTYINKIPVDTVVIFKHK